MGGCQPHQSISVKMSAQPPEILMSCKTGAGRKHVHSSNKLLSLTISNRQPSVLLFNHVTNVGIIVSVRVRSGVLFFLKARAHSVVSKLIYW